jgi:hypothetical protein
MTVMAVMMVMVVVMMMIVIMLMMLLMMMIAVCPCLAGDRPLVVWVQAVEMGHLFIFFRRRLRRPGRQLLQHDVSGDDVYDDAPAAAAAAAADDDDVCTPSDSVPHTRSHASTAAKDSSISQCLTYTAARTQVAYRQVAASIGAEPSLGEAPGHAGLGVLGHQHAAREVHPPARPPRLLPLRHLPRRRLQGLDHRSLGTTHIPNAACIRMVSDPKHIDP